MLTERDTCTPKRISGDVGSMELREGPDEYLIYYVEGDDRGAHHSIIHGALIPKVGLRTDSNAISSTCPNSLRTRIWNVVNDVGPIEVRYTEHFGGLVHCDFDPNINYVGVPQQDCAASILLRYQLVESCEKPCSIRSVYELPNLDVPKLICECG
ncbi:hypothetical protein ACLEPN_15350 [Myxococcus sp. 1LA]